MGDPKINVRQEPAQWRSFSTLRDGRILKLNGNHTLFCYKNKFSS